jgi:hypothetical protein
MGRKIDLKPEEKQKIVELLSHSKTSLDISSGPSHNQKIY